MADGLAEALLGLNFSPAQDPYGLAQQALATSSPSLISPYASTGKAIGIGLGSVLLQSLLGYQARQSAMQDTIQTNTLANQMLKMQTPEERTALISQEGVPSAIRSRLSTLAAALTAQEQARQNDLLKLQQVANLEVEKNRAIDAGVPLTELKKLDEQRAARRAALFGLPTDTTGMGMAMGGTDAASMLANPETQQLLSKPDKAALEARAKLTALQREETDKLRKEFSSLPEVKDYSLIDKAAKVVTQAVKDPSAVATQELVRRAVQLIEPGMAVREGEQAAIAKSQSIPDYLKGQLQTALSGEGGLQEDVRQGILRIAQRSYESSAERYKATKDFYEGIAKERNLPVKDISYLGESKPWSVLTGGAKSPEVQNKEAQLNNILSQLKNTTDPARIKELKQQAATIYSGR